MARATKPVLVRGAGINVLYIETEEGSGVYVPVSQNVPPSSTSNTPAIATDATALAGNANRKQWSIQNVGTNPLFVRLGAGASATVFHFILKGGTADNDGLGAFLSDNTFTGVVSIAGTSPKYVVSELT